MKKGNKEKGKLIQKINSILEESPGVLLGGMTIELLSGKQVTVEGIKAILEYDDTIVVLRDNKSQVRIMGNNLFMPYMTDHSIVIEGDIQSVEYMNGGVRNGK